MSRTPEGKREFVINTDLQAGICHLLEVCTYSLTSFLYMVEGLAMWSVPDIMILICSFEELFLNLAGAIQNERPLAIAEPVVFS